MEYCRAVEYCPVWKRERFCVWTYISQQNLSTLFRLPPILPVLHPFCSPISSHVPGWRAGRRAETGVSDDDDDGEEIAVRKGAVSWKNVLTVSKVVTLETKNARVLTTIVA